MTTYIAKRLLLMIPTLFFAVLIIFAILNFAPGSPASTSMGAQGTQSASGQSSWQSFQIFKQQFNLDKPVLLNTRFSTRRETVVGFLKTIANSKRPACPAGGGGSVPDDCIPAEEKPGSKALIEARTSLNDWGDYIVPELASIAANHGRLDIRRLALRQLASNAKGELIVEHGRSLTAAEQKRNERISRMNDKLAGWAVPADASANQIDRLLEEKWRPWLESHHDRFHYSVTERAWAFFFDTRFAKYIANLAVLDFGISHVDKQPVLETMWRKLRRTICLTFPAMVLAFLISVPIGIWSASTQREWADQAMTTTLMALWSLPSFVAGLVLLKLFAVGDPFDWFPPGGFVGNNPEDMTTLQYANSVALHLVLPVFCLTYRRLAGLSRYARTGIIDVVRSDYVRTARAKGLAEPVVIIKHASRNGMIPILTLLGTRLPRLISGSLIIEVVFNIPGMGSYLLNSILARDYNAMMAVLFFVAVLTLIGILISDICYALVDPRISFD